MSFAFALVLISHEVLLQVGSTCVSPLIPANRLPSLAGGFQGFLPALPIAFVEDGKRLVGKPLRGPRGFVGLPSAFGLLVCTLPQNRRLPLRGPYSSFVRAVTSTRPPPAAVAALRRSRQPAPTEEWPASQATTVPCVPETRGFRVHADEPLRRAQASAVLLRLPLVRARTTSCSAFGALLVAPGGLRIPRGSRLG